MTIRVLVLSAFAFAAAGAAEAAPDPAAVALAELVKPLLLAPSKDFQPGDWSSVEAARAVRWAAKPVMLDKPSPDGNFFARPGQAVLAGHPVGVVASGARTMVFSVYIRDSAPPLADEALTAGFSQAGFTLTAARCAPGRHWYRLSLAGKRPAYLYAGPLASGGGGYTLYLDALPDLKAGETAPAGGRCPG